MFNGTPGLGLLLAAALLYAFTELVIEWRSKRRQIGPSSTPHDRGSKAALVVSVGTGVILAFLAQNLPVFAISGSGITTTVVMVAVALLLVATAGRIWAVRTLGQWFTTDVRTDTAQPVIDTGPYRWVRHPSYTAAILALVGIGLTFDNWASLAAMVVFPLIGFGNRIRMEERALFTALGKPYREYARTHRRLVPGLW